MERREQARQIEKLARGLPTGQHGQFLVLACAGDDELQDEVRARLAQEPELPTAEASDGGEGPVDGAQSEAAVFRNLLRRLASRQSYERYLELERLTEGGQGAILRVRDLDLRRDLAMKVLLDQAGSLPSEITPWAAPEKLARFLEEAQVAGQLDHPGIVPVHELGIDPSGRIYFTMKLVKGLDLAAIFEREAEGRDGWTKPRVLGVLLKVCEAMAYAHSKGVIHRDLKPANVMVGKFGEVFVMDWGLARILGKADPFDLRIRPDEALLTAPFETERSEHREGASDSPLYTMDGHAVGTPPFMSPEQANGRIELMGPASDVYAVGAMLYQLIAGQVPYVPPGARLRAREVHAMVCAAPPTPLEKLAPRAPQELVAICEHAMAREPTDRYPDMSALARDLSAYIEGRVVKAHAAGTWIETRKWIQRNKPLAASLGAVFVLLMAGAGLFSWLNADLERQRAGLLSLSAGQRLSDLQLEADANWTLDEILAPGSRRWIANAKQLTASLDDTGGGVGLRGYLEELHGRRLDPSAAVDAGHSACEYASEDDTWWHNQLVALVASIEAFSDPQTGLIDGVSPEHGWGVRRRLEFVETLPERSVSGPDAQRRWNEAIASIADPSRSPRYAGLVITAQLGLLPIGRDPDSGLWEFWHLASGSEPGRDADGRLQLTEDMGVVLVLLPGGWFHMGAQADDPGGLHYDPDAQAGESPVHAVSLSPFFLAKYEFTQGQWLRAFGTNPSQFGEPPPGKSWPNAAGLPWSRLQPVEQVGWEESVLCLARMGLSLPSEAQWEYGCRAGTDSVYSSGNAVASLQGVANLIDRYAKHHGLESWPIWEQELDDGVTYHARVGSFSANAFGLHDMHGNVWEWCFDAESKYPDSLVVDPVAVGDESSPRIRRGGGFMLSASVARSATRNVRTPDARPYNLGLRAARALQR